MAVGIGLQVLIVNFLAAKRISEDRWAFRYRQRPGGRRSDRGLTLVEILILLLILSAIVLAVLPGILSRLDEARAEATRDILQDLSQSLERYKVDNQLYPTTEQGLTALVRMPEHGPIPRHWNSDGYFRGSIGTDAWGNVLIYESSGRREYQITSLGSDGQPGGEGYAADILLRRKDTP